MFVDDLFNKKTLTESNGGGSPWHSEPEQQQMDANRRGGLERERNAGLDEPDDVPSGAAPTSNGVYEYTVPAGQEDIAQELGLQQHRGHWVSRVPIQRANFQFGRPQFHEIPTQGVAEGLGKDIKRGMAGWGAFDKDKPADVVKRVKGQDTDTLKTLSRTGPTGKGSPAELQQKAISRELKKREQQGVAEVAPVTIGSKVPKSDTETFGLEKGRGYKINNPKDWKPGDRPRAVQQLIPTQDKKDHIRSRLGKHKSPVLPEQGVAEGMLDNPGEQDSPVASAIVRRILLQRTDLLSKYGPEKVGQAVDEVADFVGDVDEIGSSDVSGWVRHVEQMLGNMTQGVAEGSDKIGDIRIGDIVRAVVDGKRVQGEVIDIFPEYGEVELWLSGVNAFNPVTVDVQDTEVVSEQGVTESSDELYGLRVGDTVRAVVNGKRVQGDVIDIFPETMEVELLLRSANAGQTVTVDVRDTEALNEQNGSAMNEDWRSEIQDIDDWANAVREKLKATPQAQRLSMAQKLSQIEKKNFGSETTDRQRYNNQTGNVDANRTMQGLSNVVYEVYMDLKNQANSGPVAGGFGSTGVDQSNMYAQQQAQYDTGMANHYQQHIDDYALMADPDFMEWYQMAKQSLLANSTDENARRWSADQVKRFGTKLIGQRSDLRAGYKDAYYTPQVKAILDNDVALAAEIERYQRRNFEEFMDNIEAWRKNWNKVSDKNKEKLANMTGQTVEDIEEIISSGNINRTSLSDPDDIRENSSTGQPHNPVTDAKGRTGQQWLALVNKNYPGARISQERGPWGKIYAELSDGRKLVWAPVKPDFMKEDVAENSPYDFIKPGAMVKFGMWNKPQEHRTGRVVSMANGIVKVTVDGGKTVDLHLGNKSLSIAPVSADQQGVAEGNNPVAKIKAPRAPSSPALAAPKAPAVAETIAKVERMLESVTSKKSADMIQAYVDQKFTELGLRNTTECRNLMTRVVQESAIRRRQHAKSLAK